MRTTLVHDERLTVRPYAVHIDPAGKTKKAAARRRSRCSASATLNLNALLVFAKVVEADSFSEGARRLKMPVSTVSRQVGELEAQLGVRLLERSTRSFRLTDIGAEVLEEARGTLNLRESVLGLVSSRLSSVSGVLTISVPPSIANSLITPVIEAFQASYPDVRVHMIAADRAAGLATGDCDLLIKIGPLKDSSQISRKILTFRHRLLASPSYLANRGTPETPNELPGHRLLALSSGDPEIKWSFAKCDHEDAIVLTIEPYLSVNDPISLARVLLAGMGIGDLPSMVAGEFLQKGQLIELMPQWRFDTLDVSIVYPSSRHVRRPVQEFIRFAAKLAPTLFPPCQGIERRKQKRDDVSVFDA